MTKEELLEHINHFLLQGDGLRAQTWNGCNSAIHGICCALGSLRRIQQNSDKLDDPKELEVRCRKALCAIMEIRLFMIGMNPYLAVEKARKEYGFWEE